MRSYVLLGVLSLMLSTAAARAGDVDRDHCRDCRPQTKDVCFNLVCHYELKGDDILGQDRSMDRDQKHEKECTAAATFVKEVTEEGGEVSDDEDSSHKATLDVSCDGKPLFSDPARRFTDLLGTRIQGEQGPDPAVLLPRGELHAGSEGPNGGHYSESTLELETHEGFARARGKCFIWTGFP